MLQFTHFCCDLGALLAKKENVNIWFGPKNVQFAALIFNRKSPFLTFNGTKFGTFKRCYFYTGILIALFFKSTLRVLQRHYLEFRSLLHGRYLKEDLETANEGIVLLMLEGALVSVCVNF